VNAIHEAVRGLQELAVLEPEDVEVDGLVFREVVSAVRIEGGIAQNVVPDRAAVELNYRFAPGRSVAEAEARLRELVPVGELEVLSTSPAAPPALANPLLGRLRELVPDVRPKQAWTPVAQFAEQHIDAVNFGPGATAFAHRRELASIQYFGAGKAASARTWVDHSRAVLASAVSGAAYVNYIDPSLRNWQRAYYGPNLPRLKRVKRRYDPHNLFHFAQSIRLH
jgi:succinyl-diaminopimelate desuccinylase